MAVNGAAGFVPESDDLTRLSEASQSCRGCDLYRDATQAVFGAGPSDAKIVLVGEQPGDQEDKAGQPFVGPAGRLLDQALAAAGIDREGVYVTNAVKHFKFEERGTRRIHKTPSRTEVVSCRPWLLAELDAIEPHVVVLLGATAAKSLMGSDFRLTAHRGETLRLPRDKKSVDLDIDPLIIATMHPSAILRGPQEDRETAFDALVDDLRSVAHRRRGSHNKESE
jgi:uracil-DNA glycosylase